MLDLEVRLRERWYGETSNQEKQCFTQPPNTARPVSPAVASCGAMHRRRPASAVRSFLCCLGVFSSLKSPGRLKHVDRSDGTAQQAVRPQVHSISNLAYSQTHPTSSGCSDSGGSWGCPLSSDLAPTIGKSHSPEQAG